MVRDELGSLAAFVAIAEARSFTRAAGRLGTSQSALSHRVRRLEQRLGVTLLARNTRSVSVTEAGARLLETLGPALDEIEQRLTALKGEGARIAGTLRISAADHAAETLLWPATKRVLADHPDIFLDIRVDNRLINIVSERCDAGIRLGGNIDDDMTAIPIGPVERPIALASPGYLRCHGRPVTPADLDRHRCINRRMPSLEGFAPWVFSKGRRQHRLRVSGPLAFDRPEMILQAAVDGYGVAFVLKSQAQPLLDSAMLEAVLEDWCPTVAGYHLYYPSRKQKSPALNALVEAIRFRADLE
jgi:DNA-binding transcriptional LysR family regulator